MSQPFPDKNTFALQVPPPSSLHQPPTTQASARIGAIHISEPFGGRDFVYLIEPSKYKIDYYNGFIAPPDRLLGGDLVAWISASGIFATTMQSAIPANSRYKLDAQILGLYGDYTDTKGAKAVIQLKLYLIDEQRSGGYVRFEHEYDSSEPIASKTPADLVAAWERAWARILTSAIADVRANMRADSGSQSAPGTP
jgi:ABC-type uncharacterized transport system auxiliary subunit